MDILGDDMHLFLVEDQGILFSVSRQEIHVLNTTAAAIWCCLEDGKGIADMVPELVAMFDLSPADAERFLTTALEDWRQKGFLVGSEASVAVEMPLNTYEQNKRNLPRWRDVPFAAERRYRLLSSRLRLRFTELDQEAIVHPILAHLERQADEAGHEETLIDIQTTPRGIVLYRDKQAETHCTTVDQLAPVAKGLVWMAAIEDHDFFLDIHAGVVRGEAGCIMLPAPPGSGKSTLTAALVSAGFGFFSDEVALLEEQTFKVFPMPLALCFKDTGIDAVSEFFPQVKALPLHNRADGKRVCYMPPPVHALPEGAASCPVKAVIFPQYQPNSETTLNRMTTVEALKLLMDECVVVDKPLDQHKVAALIDWITETGAYRLTYCQTDEAISRIRAL